MGDWPQGQDYNQTVICLPNSLDSVGAPAGPFGVNATNANPWPAANRAIFIPFLVYAPLIIVKIVLSNSSVSGNVDVGIYDDQQNRLVSSGSTAQAGISTVQVFDITDTTLMPGCYYAAVAMDNTTGVVNYHNTVAVIQRGFGVLSQSTAFPLPNPAVFAAAQDAYVPLITLTARTVV